MTSTPESAVTTTIISTDAPGFVKAKQVDLDPTMLNLNDKELEFFHATVSEDDEEVRSRIFDVQKK